MAGLRCGKGRKPGLRHEFRLFFQEACDPSWLSGLCRKQSEKGLAQLQTLGRNASHRGGGSLPLPGRQRSACQPFMRRAGLHPTCCCRAWSSNGTRVQPAWLGSFNIHRPKALAVHPNGADLRKASKPRRNALPGWKPITWQRSY